MPKRALLSVFDKSGIVDFASGLHKSGFQLLSTGKTASVLRDAGLPVTDVSDFTGSPEILDGRVKTLHPTIAGGILFKRGDLDHLAAAGKNAIDLVCVNFYDFNNAVALRKSHDEIVEMIDVGGPTLVRAAAKNYADVLVVTSPSQYPSILASLQSGKVSQDARAKLAAAAFTAVAAYDLAIQKYFSKITAAPVFDQDVFFHLRKIQSLRYGENPHQQAGAYRHADAALSFADIKQLNGKELSYTNLFDVQAALELAHAFKDDAQAFSAIFKHANPTGAARHDSQLEAYRNARAADALSAYGGIAVFTKAVDQPTAEEVAKTFMEIVLAPRFEPGALAVLKEKPNLRVLEVPRLLSEDIFQTLAAKEIVGGMLLQTPDKADEGFDRAKLQVVTTRQPTESEWRALEFAWKLVKVPKSNCILFTTQDMLLAAGVGQQSRVDSCQIAIEKAKRAHLSVQGAAMASEAFFPFRDTIDFAASVGVTAIVHPGGSKRDAEVIAAANEHGMTMVFTGVRHFRH